MKKSLKSLLLTCALLASQMNYAADVESHISLKQPGNKAVTYTLTDRNGKLEASAPLPQTLTKMVSRHGEDEVYGCAWHRSCPSMLRWSTATPSSSSLHRKIEWSTFIETLINTSYDLY